MSFSLPPCLVGTSRVRPANRAHFAAFLDSFPPSERGTLLTEGGSWLWEMLRANDRQEKWDVCALVPHVAGYVREATDYGMFGAGWRRLRRIAPSSYPRLGLQGVRHALGVVRRDFTTLLMLLLEVEMASFRRVRPPFVFLHPQMTDLLVAMDNRRAVERALKKIRSASGADPGLATNNLGTLLQRLNEWGVEAPAVLAPVSPYGYGMRPSREACEEGLRLYRGQLVATSEAGFDEQVAAYWKSLGVVSAVYDVPEPNVDEWQAWRSWTLAAPPRPVGVPASHRD